MPDKLRSLWDLYKGKLYLRSCIIQIKIVLPNRVKNENILVLLLLNYFPAIKVNIPVKLGSLPILVKFHIWLSIRKIKMTKNQV